MTRRTFDPGGGHIPLLSAIAEGLVTRRGHGYNAPYVFDGELLGTNQVRRLGRMALIETPMSGPPRITADGEKFLREWSDCPAG